MKFIAGQWYYTYEESEELLYAIFPNYPDTNPCLPIPSELYPPETSKYQKG